MNLCSLRPNLLLLLFLFLLLFIIFYEPVGQHAAVAALVGLAALLDAKEHHPLGAVCPELEPGHVLQQINQLVKLLSIP